MTQTKQNKYQEYLTSLHANLITPDSVINDVVQESTGKEIVTKQRIIAGEMSEVYDITLIDGQHVILRIARQGFPFFQQEKWAIDQVKKVGVPAPKILYIAYRTINRQDFAFCLMEKIDGEPLERGGIDFGALSEAERKSYIVKAGALLSKIHSIQTQGFGKIMQEGKTQYPTANACIDRYIAKIQINMYPMTEKSDLQKTDLNKAINILDAFRDDYARSRLSLNHGDYGYKHFMVNDKQIVAIIDWGAVKSDSAVNDFSWWDYWFSDFIPLAWLQEGYENKTLFDNNFEEILHTMKIIRGLEIINYYHDVPFKEGFDSAVTKLITDLEYFS